MQPGNLRICSLSRRGVRACPSVSHPKQFDATTDLQEEVPVDTPAAAVWSTALKALFILFVLLVLAAVGYAGWIVSRYWDAVGV